jgi:putative endonuclease
LGTERIELGRQGEQAAREYLERNGYWVLAQNYRCRQGEIDIIAEKEEGLHFVEVKTRKDFSYGAPAEAVTGEKQRRLRYAAAFYAMRERRENAEQHMDVIEIIAKDGRFHIRHIKDAIEGWY